MRVILTVLLATLLSWANSFAQLNESDTLKFQLRASITGNYQQGNVELLNIRSRLDFVIKLSEHIVFKSQNNSLYQEFYTIRADNDFFSRNYLYYKPKNTIYPFAMSYISTNYRRKIGSRYFVGAGTTWQAINKKNAVIKLSASMIYESTKFNETTYNFPEFNGNERLNAWRGTLYSGGWVNLFDKHIRLYYDTFWQPAFDNSSDYRAEFDVGLDFPIWKGFAFNVHYNYTHEQIVVNKIKQKNQLLSFGLSYNYRIR